MIYLYLAFGGAVGTLARYGLGSWIQNFAGTTFPWATLTINVIGSLLLGFLVQAVLGSDLSTEVRAMLTVGFCGAFTTFSTFSVETVGLLERGEWLRALSYSAGSVVLGLIAVGIGLRLAEIWFSAPA